MDDMAWQARAWADLLTSEMRWKAERFATTERARLFVEAGLPLERVLDALTISRATWYRRLAEHDEEKAANAAAYTGRDDGTDEASAPVPGVAEEVAEEPDWGECVPGCQRVRRPHTGACLRPNPRGRVSS